MYDVPHVQQLVANLCHASMTWLFCPLGLPWLATRIFVRWHWRYCNCFLLPLYERVWHNVLTLCIKFCLLISVLAVEVLAPSRLWSQVLLVSAQQSCRLVDMALLLHHRSLEPGAGWAIQAQLSGSWWWQACTRFGGRFPTERSHTRPVGTSSHSRSWRSKN